MKRPVSVAAVGIGGYGEHYTRELLRLAGHGAVRLVGVADPNPGYCSSLPAIQAAEVPVFTRMEDMLERVSPELTVISSPIHYHATQTCLALERGSDVLVEKPLCATVQDARRISETSRRTGRLVNVGFQWTYSSAMIHLKRDILAGRFGRPTLFKALTLWPRPVEYFERNGWAGRLRTEQGEWVLDSPAGNACAHHLHNMLYLLGPREDSSLMPDTLEAELYKANDIENYDTAAFSIAFSGGAEIRYYVSHSTEHEVGPILRYEFEEAVVELNADGILRARANGNGHVIEYGPPDTFLMRKLHLILKACCDGDERGAYCSTEAATPHVACINAAQQSASGVAPFPASSIRTRTDEEGKTFKHVDGLDEIMKRCFEASVMPSTLLPPGTSLPPARVSVKDLDHFPSNAPSSSS